MLSRALLVVLALFWLTMNALLWRAEFGGGTTNGNAVPVTLVWQKILTAPDSSSLVIIHHGTKIGVCHWLTSVGDDWAEVGDDDSASGAPEKVRSYELRCEGSALLPDLKSRVRFESNLKLSEQQSWQEFGARVVIRPNKLDIHGSAADQAVQIKADVGDVRYERVLKFSQLQNPSQLLQELAGPMAGVWLEGMELPTVSSGVQPGSLVRWEARESDLRIGHTPVRVYRLQTRLLDRYPVTVFVSRVGEILRVELPDELVLANDQLTPL